MENSISEKYAVYTISSDGKESLSVVVDSHEQAKKELDKLKSGTTCVKINKTKIENFGKEGEKVIESSEVECWKADDNSGSDKLSSFQKAPDATSSASGVEPNKMVEPVVVSGLTDTIKKKTFQEKLNSFYDFYSHSGDLIGVGFAFFPAPTGVLEATTATTIDNNTNSSGQTLPSSESGIKEGDEKDEIKKLTAEVSELKEKINELISVEKEEDADEEDGKDKGDKD